MSTLVSMAGQNEASIGVVCLLGVGIVFVGLICLVIVCSVFGAIAKRTVKASPAVYAPVTQTNANADIPNRQEFVAAVSAAIAEDLGKDVSAINILSIKKM